MTEEEAKAALSKKNLGYYVSGREASDKYDKGIIIRQETAAKKSFLQRIAERLFGK
jgi:serine/threonine-protein kinase